MPMTVAVQSAHTQAPNRNARDGAFLLPRTVSHCIILYRINTIQYSTHKKAENRTPSRMLTPLRTEPPSAVAHCVSLEVHRIGHVHMVSGILMLRNASPNCRKPAPTNVLWKLSLRKWGTSDPKLLRPT